MLTTNAEYMHLLPEAWLPSAAVSVVLFRAVVIADEEVSPEWQAALSCWLLQAGCLYLMAWGKNSSSWDDAVDVANMEQHQFDDIPENKFVMTTWHAGESLLEVFSFAKSSAVHPAVDVGHTLCCIFLNTITRKNS